MCIRDSLRITLSAAHDIAQVDALVDALAAIRERRASHGGGHPA